ncbi:Putative regulator of chromosome condensation 1/beta-lactamase-inhibitor protein II [Colletotrichum destructivum]|uniref:Regulator of chromosome condensation 1/beta-lactamase-inhibitor protein II n=1 Tax=Colletotrichum destructivum TaxID=34406 RepID=A0AAX4IXX1_9PEZI|nr:Putative regulator of chromosome condensation 1/beta-lactamase-inhibitor protein II [Colletotrichum destructivum]
MMATTLTSRPKILAQPPPPKSRPNAANNQSGNGIPNRPTRPTQVLDVAVWGSGENCELGLGPRITEAPRPRLAHKHLSPETVGVVQVAAGGMHCVALTRDGRVLTWGVNDDGALGRKKSPDTPEEGPEDLLGPFESTPGQVNFQEDIDIVQVAATNSACFALTAEGTVYGWGSFAGGDGNFGFLHDKPPKTTERLPVRVPGLENIAQLAGGANHALALTNDGNVLAWGSGEQNELGRRILERRRFDTLLPQRIGLPKNKTAKIFAGSHHTFAIDTAGKVWAFGLNNFGQCGIPTREDTGFTTVISPTMVKNLAEYDIRHIAGGLHHSIACTKSGKILVWGRCDDGQMGIDLDRVPREHIIFDYRGRPRVLNVPTEVSIPDHSPDSPAVFVTAGIDNCFVIAKELYAWGFSACYNTGLKTTETVGSPTVVPCGLATTCVSAGGQFGIASGPTR